MAAEAAQEFSMRPMGLDDIDHIADWFIDVDDVALYERPLPVPVSPEALRKRWETLLQPADPPQSLYFIAEDADKDPVGFCGLERINYFHGDAVVPVFVGKKMRGKGLAITMSAALIDIAFDTLRLNRLTTFYREDNGATKAIVEKLGFSVEGCSRQAWFAQGAFKDIIQVGLLRSEWTENSNARNAHLAATAASITMRHVSE